MLMLRYAPGLTDGEAWRIVLVEHFAPLAVDVVHFKTIPNRVSAVMA